MSDNNKSRSKRVDKLQIMVADSELQDIDNWRFDNRQPNRSSAIRRLIFLGLHYWEIHPEEAEKALDGIGFESPKKLP